MVRVLGAPSRLFDTDSSASLQPRRNKQIATHVLLDAEVVVEVLDVEEARVRVRVSRVDVLVGAVAVGVLSFGGVQISAVGFDVTTMVYASALCVMGYQSLLFFWLTKLYATQEGFLPASPRYRAIVARSRHHGDSIWRHPYAIAATMAWRPHHHAIAATGARRRSLGRRAPPARPKRPCIVRRP